MVFPRKLKQLPLFGMLFTYVFLTSTLIVSTLCLLLMIILWPISKNLYRRISSLLAYTVFSQFVWISWEWAGMRVHLFGEKEVYDKFGTESCLITLNHRGDLDWVAGFIIGAQYNFLHRVRTLTKRSVLFVPGFGLLLWMLEFLFLTRSFAKDERMIKRASEEYRKFPFPIQLCIFCEGTRFTEAKYQRGVQYAKEKGLKELKHHLIPRTKGFSLLAQHLKINGQFPALYDVVLAYPRNTKPPNWLDILLGRQVDIYFYLQRFPMDEVPATQEELNSYCYKLFERKDEAYEHFLQNGKFPAPTHPFVVTAPTAWRLRSIMFTWFALLIAPPLYLLTTLTWATLGVLVPAVCGVFLLIMLGFLWYSHVAIQTKKKS